MAERERMPTDYRECQRRYPDGRCPWARCNSNLMIDVTDAGSLVLNYPAAAPTAGQRLRAGVIGRDVTTTPEIDERMAALVAWWAGKVTCERHRLAYEELTQAEVGALMSLTRQRVDQLEARALVKLRLPAREAGLAPGHADQAVLRRRDEMARVSSATTVTAQPEAAPGESDDAEVDPGPDGDVGVCGDDRGADAQPCDPG